MNIAVKEVWIDPSENSEEREAGTFQAKIVEMKYISR